MKTLVIALVFLFPFFNQNADAQVFDDFESGTIQGWVVEGDGWPVFSDTLGNPGKCLQVNEPATGATNFLVFPGKYLGNWSIATAEDSIFYDFISFRLTGTVVTLPYYAEISGPGGRMRFQPNAPNPGQTQWIHKSIRLDSSLWVIQSGSFSAIMQDVRTVKVIAEFISGNEIVRFDNIGISFSPLQSGFASSGCSTFEAGELLDGWNFQNSAGVTSVATDGNPPNCLRIIDQANVLTLATAPPKFYGNWNTGMGTISFDLKVTTTLTAKIPPPYLIKLSGPMGSAQIQMTNAMIDSIRNRWFTFIFPLDSTDWEMVSGTWDGLIQQVFEISLGLEFYNGTNEIVFFDNFCLNIPTPTSTSRNQLKKVGFSPNPAQNEIVLDEQVDWLQLIDAKGQIINSWKQASGKLELGKVCSGFYIIRFSVNHKITHSKLLIE